MKLEANCASTIKETDEKMWPLMAHYTEIKLPTSAGSWKKQESSRKTSISALLTTPKPLTVMKVKAESEKVGQKLNIQKM